MRPGFFTVGLVAAALGIALWLMRCRYIRWAGREYAKAFRDFGDRPEDWERRYRHIPAMGAVIFVGLGLVSIWLGSR